jgi:arylsulfatase A-like enzyme
MYGLNDKKGEHPISLGPAPFGRQCLTARRLVERGVRFIQIYSGGGGAGGQNTWDGHHGIEENLAIHAPEVDKPIAALLTDLEQRGLLDETLVVWGGEFGRMPVSETFNTGGKPGGRDHNPKGFTYWMAGAGVKGGVSYGETDDFGQDAVVNRHHLRDLHATILHLMGLDHRKLTYFYGGLENKLTGVQEAEVIRGLIA